MTKYRVLERPNLIEFLQVLHKLPQDEKDWWACTGGQPFDAQKAAAQMVVRDDPAWVLYADEEPIAIAGFTEVRPGVWQDWMFSTPVAWTDHWREVSKQCRRGIDALLREGAHRVQCISLASRTEAHRWYRVLGYELEGRLRAYGAGGEDALIFSKVRTPHGVE